MAVGGALCRWTKWAAKNQSALFTTTLWLHSLSNTHTNLYFRLFVYINKTLATSDSRIMESLPTHDKEAHYSAY